MPPGLPGKRWGSVARHGASQVVAVNGAGGDRRPRDGDDGDTAGPRPAAFEPERFELVDEDGSTGRRPRGGLQPRPHRTATPAELPADLLTELASAAGSDWSHLRNRVSERMLAALGAYQRERYRDAARMLRTVVAAVPAAPSPHELLGLSQYRQGQWRAARSSLEVFADLSGSIDQHPVLMDCERALGRPRRVEARFEQLRQASPDPEVLSEGRLVLAGTKADAGNLAGAIEVLVEAGAGRKVRNPAPRHVRQWYALGDLAERSGDLVRARDLFSRVAAADHDAYDVGERLAQLGPESSARRGNRPRREKKETPLGR